MPKWLIIVFAFLIVILIGVNSYLFYLYSQKKPAAEVAYAPQHIVNLSGQIKPGWELPQDQKYCVKSYYLVDANNIPTEIRTENQVSTNGNLRLFSNVSANITGVNRSADGVSCGDFVDAQIIKIVPSDPTDFDINGTISCLPGEDPTTGTCTKNLQVGDAHLFFEINTFVGTADVSKLQVGDQVKVTGATDNSYVSDNPSFDGAILVTAITKL